MPLPHRNCISKLNTPSFAFPDNVQARKFTTRIIHGCKSFGDQTLTAAINRSKACEIILTAGKTKLIMLKQSETVELAKVAATELLPNKFPNLKSAALVTHVENRATLVGSVPREITKFQQELRIRLR